MRVMGGLIVGLLIAVFPLSAMAGDFCISESYPMNNTLHVVWKAFKVPPKGVCKPIFGIIPDQPGFIFNGGGSPRGKPRC